MLVVNNLYKYFTTNELKKYVLQDISFTVKAGEFICLLGPSGCGKTTLLRCIGGFEPFSAGKILVNGQPVLGPGIDRMMVFQGFDQLFSWKTVYANAEYPLQINGLAKNDRHNLVLRYLTMVGLQDYTNYYPYQLSGGMKQRAALARAMVLQPRILLMDEPFGNLDALTRNALQGELLKIWSETTSTILFVTHDIEEAILLSDRIIMLSPSGELKDIIPNQLERPRKPGRAGFVELWERLYSQLGA